MFRFKKPGNAMPAVDINKPAPDFTLPDFEGNLFQLSTFKGSKHVLIVLNRGFF